MTGESKNNINFNTITENEKFVLKNKLTHSIHAYIHQKKRYRYSFIAAAASVAILFSVVLYNQNNTVYSPIEKFAKTIQNVKPTNEVALILSDQKNVEITVADSTIVYSNSGTNIAIGASKTIKQETILEEEIAFNTLLVPYGKRKKIVLSDGTKVWLNSGSKLVFPVSFKGDKREVFLEGEAIFEVAHNSEKPFFVKATNYNIKVLGTVFSVSNYTEDKDIETVLESGSVQINYKNNDLFSATNSLEIVPGNLATYSKENKSLKVKTVDTEKYFAWRDGIFIFRNDSLASIMKKLSRYYDYRIIIKDKKLAEHTFSGYLDVNEDINHVMKTIMAAENYLFDYKITTDKKIIIN
jgi:hypothetical protein